MGARVSVMCCWVPEISCQHWILDQATGSTHCVLIPYWASRLGKSSLSVKQISERTGEVTVEAAAPGTDTAVLIAPGVKVMQGKMVVPGDGWGDGGGGRALRVRL